MSRFITTAVPWIRIGANVLPILPGAKSPAVNDWGRPTPAKPGPALHSKDSPKITLETYSAWANEFGDCNAAVFPATLDATVVDVDRLELLDAVLAVCGPTDYRTISGRAGGGVHLWYAGAGASRNAITPGVDIKSSGGYVLAPGSLHAKTGNDYTASPALAAALASGALQLPPMRPGWREALSKLGAMVTAPTRLNLAMLADKLQASVAMRTLAKILRLIANGEPFAQPGEREQAIYLAVRRMAEEWPHASEDSIVALFERSASLMEAAAPVDISIEDQVRSKWQRFAAAANGPAEGPAPEGPGARPARPVVQLGGDDLETLEAIGAALLARGTGTALFRQGGSLVTVDGAATADRVAVELARAIAFQRDGAPSPVPSDLARKVAAAPPDLPELRCRREAPILHPDGSIVYEAGYDAETRTWCDGWPDGWPRADTDDGEAGARGQAAAACLRLLQFVHGAAWEEPCDWQSWLAHVLTVAARPAIDGPVPAWIYSSAAPGSGKTTLAKLAGIIGGRCGDYTDPSVKDDAELARRLDGYASRPAILLDNLHGTLRSPLLEGAVTGGKLAVRRLYVGPVTVPWVAVMSVTSNGAEVGADWARRAMPVRLDSRALNGEIDLEGDARERPDLTSDALAIVSAWLRTDRGQTEHRTLLGFGAWSRVVAGALHWALGVDVVASTRASASELVAGEEDGTELLNMIAAWCKASGKSEFAARELWDAPTLYTIRESFPTLRAFSSRLGRLVDAERVLRKRSSHGAKLYRIVPRGAAETSDSELGIFPGENPPKILARVSDC